VRSGAAPYSYDTVYFSNYYYAAPGWYRPWVYVGDRWTYRPYPYHDYYYRAYRPYHPYGWGNRGYYGRRVTTAAPMAGPMVIRATATSGGATFETGAWATHRFQLMQYPRPS
jgi:hypothetical protein